MFTSSHVRSEVGDSDQIDSVVRGRLPRGIGILQQLVFIRWK